jgi:hypothetical protein
MSPARASISTALWSRSGNFSHESCGEQTYRPRRIGFHYFCPDACQRSHIAPAANPTCSSHSICHGRMDGPGPGAPAGPVRAKRHESW